MLSDVPISKEWLVSSGPDENRHVSGLYTQMLVSYLQERLSPAAMGRVLLRAGESRDLEELSNISSWSSYQQFRRLLQEARLESDSVQTSFRATTP